MSLLDLKSVSHSSLVEKILEQGQRLRNSMVEAVLNNDPFCTEILNSYNNTPRTNVDSRNVDLPSSDNNENKKSYSKYDVSRVHRYLCGEEMCMNEENKALETLRTISPNSLVRSTSDVASRCHNCDVCNKYENIVFPGSVLSTDRTAHTERHTHHQKHSSRKEMHEQNGCNVHVRSTNTRAPAIRQEEIIETESQENLQKSSSKLKAVKETFRDNKNLLKYVDSLKICVYSLKLNNAGNRKVMATENFNKPYLSAVNTYFVEYTLPDILNKNILKSRAKVNSGLKPNKTVRLCSRKTQSESIYFKQESIHEIKNINMIDLATVKIEFRVSYRSIKQRNALLIGKATFNVGYLQTNSFFTSEQELALICDGAPVAIGSLKISAQLGCDKLYFGKEFIKAISCSKENTNLSESDSIHKLSDHEQTARPKTIKNSEKTLAISNQNVKQNETKIEPTHPSTQTDQIPVNTTEKVVTNTDDDTPLLYALIHISEVRLLTISLNSYIICRGFSRDDTITSRTVYNDFKPVFNLYQLIPVLLSEDFINRLRDNYVIVEIWEKKEDEVDNLLGVSKLSLHQLYVAYRNPAIVRHLVKNPNPVIGVDWWEPITCIVSNTETGQLRGLVALGSLAQIESLEQSRKLKHFTEKNPPKQTTYDLIENRHKSFSSLSLHSDYNLQNKLPSAVHFEVPEKTAQVTSRINSFDNIDDKNYFFNRPERISRTASFDRAFNRVPSFEKTVHSNYFPEKSAQISSRSISAFENTGDTNYLLNRPERISRTTSFDRAFNRVSSFEKTDHLNYFPQHTERINRATSFEKPIEIADKTTNKDLHNIFPCDEIRNRDNFSRTILVSDKSVQQPEIEITPSLISVDKTVVTTNRSKVDVSTQSELTEMDSEKDKTSPTNNQFSQKDFLNSFLEQLLSSRDVNQKNIHVENSTNTESLPLENTSHKVIPVVDNKPSTALSSAGSQNDPNLTKSHLLNTTFPRNSVANSDNSNAPVRNTSDLLDSLQKALLTGNKNELDRNSPDEKEIGDSFKAHIVIENALHLPSRKKCKSKRNKNKSPKNNEEILPSTYVTFKGCLDGDYRITSVVPKSTSPRWDHRCDIHLTSELLVNNQKRLIFKVWRKANGPSLQPNYQTDIILGFAALDLTVLLSGLPNVQGWFNITDFSGKCNGQIKINVTPLENLSKFNEYKRSYIPEKLRSSIPPKEPELEPEVNEDSIPSELLSRALKRKFTELDEITQRLRQRLSAVTNDDSDLSNDDFADEFERDLNTICVDNFPKEQMAINVDDLKNSGEIATSSKVHSTSDLLASLNVPGIDSLINFSSRNSENDSSMTVSEVNVPTVQENLSKLDTHLTEGKLKIDSLLEKLSLLTGDNDNQNKSDPSFSSRYVSGCSINHETETSKDLIDKPESSNQVLKDLGMGKLGNIDPDLIFNPVLFQQMFTASLDSTPRLDSLECMSSIHCTTLKNLVEDSISSGSLRDLQSISSNSLSEDRQAPDGAGNISND